MKDMNINFAKKVYSCVAFEGFPAANRNLETTKCELEAS
jgi:hypothetical protein